MKNKKILCFFLLLITFILSPIAVSAKGDNLPSGVLIGDDDGFRVESDGYYFIEEKGIMPGHSFTRKISIGNYSEQLKMPITIEMGIDYDKNPPVVKGQENLLSLIQVTYKIDDKILYEGSLDGSGIKNNRDKKQPVTLGSFKQGETAVLIADFKVPQDVDVRKWGSENSVEYYNVFHAKRDPQEKEPEKKKPGLAGLLPQTGEDLAFLLLGTSLGFLIIMFIVKTTMNKKDAAE